MRYQKLAKLYEELSSTTKRLEKVEILSKFFEVLPKDDSEVIYLLMGKIYPEYDERKIGISNQLVIKTISKATGTEIKKIIHEWKMLGDLGEVAEKFTLHKKQSTLNSHILTTTKVLENLRKLPSLEGKGTVNKKLGIITELLTSADPLEAKYITRSLIGDLRIGIQESTIRDALALAFFKKDKDVSEIIQKAIDKSNDLVVVLEIAKQGKIKELEKVSLQIGKPIKAMLAQKAVNPKEGFVVVGKPCIIEYKYDGFRLLIHKNDEVITLFTRSLENVTAQFPEVVEYVNQYVKGKTFILDSEAVGYDKKTKKYTEFQAISQRIRRKHNIEKLQKELPVEVNVFDILYFEGKSQLDEPFEKRSKLLRSIVKDTPYKIIASKQIITDDEEKAMEFYNQALENNQEGIMMKKMDAEYRSGRRVGNMIKVKPEEKDLDLVITGAEYGTGKRSGWLSSFILSCWDGEKFLEIGKVGTGIKEKETAESGNISFKELTEKLKPYIITEKGKNVTIEPKIVVAVTYQEIQKSPNYNSGLALRFPRFTALRPDKKPEQANTLKEILEDLKNQKR